MIAKTRPEEPVCTLMSPPGTAYIGEQKIQRDLLFLMDDNHFSQPGLLILQYNIPIGTIANTFFSIGTVLQYFFFIFGIGIANTYIGYRYCQLVHQYQYSSNFPHG